MAISVLTVQALNELTAQLKESFENVGVSAWDQNNEKWLALLQEEIFDKRSARFPFILPTMDVDWIPEGDPIPFQTLVGTYLDISLREMAGGAEIKRVDIADKQYVNALMKQIMGLPKRAENRIVREVFDAFNNGESNTQWVVYDGQQLFSNTHTVGAENVAWDNLIAGTGITASALQTDVNTVISTVFEAIPWGPDGSNGQFMPIDNAKFTVIAPPTLRVEFLKAIFNTQLAESNIVTENVWATQLKGMVNVEFSNRMETGNHNWVMMMELSGHAPFIHARHVTEGTRELRTDLERGGLADYQRMLRWWLASMEEVKTNHYWLFAKVLNA